ncbi:nicotinamide-nucleotide amidase [Clostridiales Family XIII bacterium PM5-7]
MKTAILSVGTELLFGQITNTNTVYLSQQLNLLGFDVMYHYTVGDNTDRLAEIIEMAFRDCDLIITTGGLGPTEDDLTKETVCQVLHDQLVNHEESLKTLYAIMEKRGRVMTENNLKQALMPSRAVVFDNDAGTAPGFALSEGEKTVVCMPGPPREMTRMWQRRVKPFLEQKQDAVIYYQTLRLFGIGESALETELLHLIDGQTDPTIATYAKEGECSLRIASKRKTLDEAKAAVEAMIHQVEKVVGQYIYSLHNEELAEVVGKKLIERNISISACESCTGGLFAEQLTRVPGVSKVFNRSLVTYTPEAKIQELGVAQDTLNQFTAESSQVAKEMVEGLKKKTRSRMCISVTGIAGPEDQSEERPAGLIYIGCTFDDETEVFELRTGKNNRQWNRQYACLNMFHYINLMLEKD